MGRCHRYRKSHRQKKPCLNHNLKSQTTQNCDYLDAFNRHGEGHIDEFDESKKTTYREHRSGNTFRQKGIKNIDQNKVEFEANNMEKSNKIGNYIEVPISGLEVEFPQVLEILINKHSIAMNSYFSFYRSMYRSGYGSNFMNKSNLWEIHNFLEENSSKKSEKTLISVGFVETSIEYEMPIIDTKKISIKHEKISYKDNGKFIWNDVIYESDPDILYEIVNPRSEELSIAVKYNFVETPVNIVTIPFTIIAKSTEQKCYAKSAKIVSGRVWDSEEKKLIKPTESFPTFGSINHHACSNYNYWKAMDSDKESFVVLDMGEGRKIKYISTLGRPPMCEHYPKNPSDKRDKILVVVSTPREYVTKYAVYGRTENSQWIFIGNYTGNNDPYIEKINDISNDVRDSIRFRYIKIVPLAYYGSKSMRFMIYGNVADNPFAKEPNTETTTITYTLNFKSKEKFKRDHGSYKYNWGDISDGIKIEKTLCNKITKAYNTDRNLYNEKYNDYY